MDLKYLIKLKEELSFSKGYNPEDKVKMRNYLAKCRLYNYPKYKKERLTNGK